MSKWYDIDGNPITMWDWAVKLEARDMTEYGIIGQTRIEDVRVSTVWMGLDMSFAVWEPDHVPLIFETMIFGLDDDEIEHQWRYATKEAALAGHDQAVALVRQVLGSRT